MNIFYGVMNNIISSFVGCRPKTQFQGWLANTVANYFHGNSQQYHIKLYTV